MNLEKYIEDLNSMANEIEYGNKISSTKTERYDPKPGVCCPTYITQVNITYNWDPDDIRKIIKILEGSVNNKDLNEMEK